MSTQKKTLSAKPPMMTKNTDYIAKKEQEMNFINEGWVTVPSPNLPQTETVSSASNNINAVWAPNGARDDVVKSFNLRLSEPVLLKLKYVAQQQRLSINSICTRLIKEFVDKELGK